MVIAAVKTSVLLEMNKVSGVQQKVQTVLAEGADCLSVSAAHADSSLPSLLTSFLLFPLMEKCLP